MIGRQCGGIFPPGGAMPISKRVGLGRLGQRADAGNPPADAENFLAGLAGRLPIEHGDHFLRAIAEQADGGLGGVGVVVPVGDDHHAAGRGHGRSLTARGAKCKELQPTVATICPRFGGCRLFLLRPTDPRTDLCPLYFGY